MAKTVSNGWRSFTPGECLACGFDDDWECDGRGTVFCGCERCAECGEHDGHAQECPEVSAQVAADMGYDDDEAHFDGGRRSDAEGRL